MRKPASVSILGASRSGTTAVGLALGAIGGHYLGEVESLRRNLDTACSCGAPPASCSFWAPVLAEVGMSGPAGPQLDPGEYLVVHAAIAALHPGVPILDSSKSPHLVRALTADAADRITVHLVRDPRGLALSRHRGWSRRDDDGSPPGWWTVATASVTWQRRNAQIRRIASPDTTVRYEDLAEDGAIDGLASELGLPRDRAGSTHHVIAGNPVRKQGPVTFRVDDEWTTRLPAGHQLVGWATALPEVRRHRYRPRSTAG